MKMNEPINPTIYSFPPIANPECTVLILGTMPGKESLRAQAYYAHGQNAFWKIIFALYNRPFSFNIEIRKEILLQNGIALWDVLKYCERESSLDSDIRQEVPNDLRTFLFTYPYISKIFFNGAGAGKFFKKYFPDINLPTLTLPSTSPAHAIKWEHKLQVWTIINPETDKKFTIP
jgi:hypoxanthine-DNA glycosylase